MQTCALKPHVKKLLIGKNSYISLKYEQPHCNRNNIIYNNV